MFARYKLKAKIVPHEVLNLLRSWFSRYPVFKVYIIKNNNASNFSANAEIFNFPKHVYQLSIEKEASPPVPWSRVVSLQEGGGVFLLVAIASAGMDSQVTT